MILIHIRSAVNNREIELACIHLVQHVNCSRGDHRLNVQVALGGILRDTQQKLMHGALGLSASHCHPNWSSEVLKPEDDERQEGKCRQGQPAKEASAITPL